MTSRTYNVVQKQTDFWLDIFTTYAKAKSAKKKTIAGYLSYSAATSDITRFQHHIESGSRFDSFVPEHGMNPRTARKRPNEAATHGVNGIARKKQRKACNRRYNIYLKKMKLASLPALVRSDWDSIFDAADPKLRAVALESFARDPIIRQEYLLHGLRSEDQESSKKSVSNAINYVTERIKTLAKSVVSSKEALAKIRLHVFGGTAFKLLLKARFEEEMDDEIVDLTEDDIFTFQNTSKEQMGRVCLQAYVVSTM
jgi:hypothetical protein